MTKELTKELTKEMTKELTNSFIFCIQHATHSSNQLFFSPAIHTIQTTM